MAEDDDAVRALVTRYLTQAGCTVRGAHDGNDALRILATETPDLALLDCQMPGLDGFELSVRIRADHRFSDCPVVFLTAMSEPQDVVRGFRAGGVDYVRKPVVAAELLARIGAHIELAAARRAERERAERLQGVTEQQGQCLAEVRTGQELLLTSPARFPELTAAVRFEPAHIAGGDFYEIARLSTDSYALFVADVSGHDLSTSFITGALKALTASFVDASKTPDSALQLINTSLNRFLSSDRFVSACYARFSRDSMRLDVTCAGHPSPILHRAHRPPEYLDLTGDVLGVFEKPDFGSIRLEVSPGDRLYLFTDGLTEGLDASAAPRERLHAGQRRLKEILREADGTLDQVVDVVLAARRAGRNALEDDIVLLGVEF